MKQTHAGVFVSTYSNVLSHLLQCCMLYQIMVDHITVTDCAILSLRVRRYLCKWYTAHKPNSVHRWSAVCNEACDGIWAPSQYKDRLRMAISMLKIRRPLGRLIFNMRIAIPGKTVFLIETAPWWFCWDVRLHRKQFKATMTNTIMSIGQFKATMTNTIMSIDHGGN